MTKEFEIRMAQKKQEDSQKRINCKETINKIFEKLSKKDKEDLIKIFSKI